MISLRYREFRIVTADRNSSAGESSAHRSDRLFYECLRLLRCLGIYGRSVAALYLQDANSVSRLGAQEPSRGQIPGLATAVGGAWSGVGQPVGPQDLTPDERVNIAVYENVNRSVVNINTKARTEALFILEIPTEGMGSGSVLDKSGHILTNFHVVDGGCDRSFFV